MHRRRSRLRPGGLRRDPSRRGSKFKVPGSTLGSSVPSSRFKVPGQTRNRIQLGTRNPEPERCVMGPQINVIGSFFPSWMLCAAIGIVAALLGRWLFKRTGLDPYVGTPAVVYYALGMLLQ